MIHKKKGAIEWLEFKLLSHFPHIKHGVFLRHGGVSQGVYSSLNTIKTIGDDLGRVEENHARILQVLGIKRLIHAQHVHQTDVHHIKIIRNKPLVGDGLMTLRKNLGLLSTHADCQAAIFYDPVHDAIANVHCGWRGQVKNIYQKTVAKMAQSFGTRPQDLLVCISPSLGPMNSEFKYFEKELPESFWPFQIKPTYFDLWAIARHQLQTCGVPASQIEIACIDTYSNPHDFFSYRREKAAGRTDPITGCHGTVISVTS